MYGSQDNERVCCEQHSINRVLNVTIGEMLRSRGRDLFSRGIHEPIWFETRSSRLHHIAVTTFAILTTLKRLRPRTVSDDEVSLGTRATKLPRTKMPFWPTQTWKDTIPFADVNLPPQVRRSFGRVRNSLGRSKGHLLPLQLSKTSKIYGYYLTLAFP